MPDWRDAAAYAPLLGADRSLFAWEWLRRDPDYRSAAARSASCNSASDAGDEAGRFGLVALEPAHLAVPNARPLWNSAVHPYVLATQVVDGASLANRFALESVRALATVVASEEGEHLLLSDGLRAVRLDVAAGALGAGPVRLRYLIEGLAEAEPRLSTLRRFLGVARHGCFAPSLNPRERKARRWILMLRAWDGLAAGADQRDIACELVSRSAAAPAWRSREPSIRLQAQRLVRSARVMAAGGYPALLR